MKVRGPLVTLLVVLLSACGVDRPTSTASAPSREVGEAARPVGLEIPASDVHVDDVQSTRSLDGGDDDCPRDPQAVTWNSSGTSPGDPGLAVMIGSADGVFRRLADLGPDDLIVVNRADGTRVTFKRSDTTAAAPGAGTARLQLNACGGRAPVKIYSEVVR